MGPLNIARRVFAKISQLLDVSLTGIGANEWLKWNGSAWVNRDATETKTDLSLDSVENTALSTWGGSANITTVGDLSAGSIEGTAIKSTGEAGGTKYLREDGDGTCSWQTVAGGSSALNDLTDVTAPTPTQGETITWNGSGWVNSAIDLADGDAVTGVLPTGNVATTLTGKTLTTATIDGDNNTISNLDLGNEVEWAAADDVTTRSAFASGDKILIFEAGVGMRKVDYDDLPGAGGGLSNIVEDTTPQLGGELDLNNFALTIECKNDSGGNLALGDAVYVSGFDTGVTDLPEITLADSDSGGTMPAVGVCAEAITNGTQGAVAINGTLTMATTGLSVGDTLYVSGVGTTGNTLTTTKPVGAALIQKVGTVLRVGGSSVGRVFVSGANRSNDIPNFTGAEAFWYGGASGIASEGTLAAGVRTFLETPSSANLASAVTNETGTGNLVFSNSPALVTPDLGVPSAGTLSGCDSYPGDSSLTTVGTVTTGTWQATDVGVAHGGTGSSSAAGARTNLGAGSIQRYRTLFVDAAAMLPCTTNPADNSASPFEYGTNDIDLDYYAFDSGVTEERVQFKLAMPDDWDRSTIKVKFFWSTATGSSIADTVEWGIKGGAVSDNDAIDAALGTAQTVSDTVLADNGADMQVTAATSALTVGGSPALGDMIIFEVYRNTDGTDNCAEDAWLFGVQIQYQTLTTEPIIW